MQTGPLQIGIDWKLTMSINKVSNARSIRKFINNIWFNHQGFSEARKLINDKEKHINIERVNVIISYIDNLVQISTNLIEYGHGDMEFIETCMKLSAYILITDYSDYSQELAMQESSLHKGVWLIKLLWKVKKLKSWK